MGGILFPLLGLILLAGDRWTKHWVVRHLALGETAPLIPGVVELQRVHNTGAAWSSFAGQRWLLIAVSAAVLAAVAWSLRRKVLRHPLGRLAGWLILSGGTGNLIDRVYLGYVVDMLHLEFYPSYPTFNLADMCIVAGAASGAVYYLFFHDRRPSHEDTDLSGGS